MFSEHNVVLLVGGVGGAKLAYGLAQIIPPEKLTIIVNTGDDFWHYGLRICPDLDTITYTLSGMVNTQTGWGVAEDTQTAMDALRNLGETPWFQLGDRDLATHLLRTHLWREGKPLSIITERIAESLGVGPRLLPMTDVPVATMVDTVEYGELGFQVYFVKHRWQPTVKSIRYAGAEGATLSPQVRGAIEAADAIIVGPSNPWLSIQPVLSVPGMVDLLAGCDVPRIAVTPLIEGRAIKGPTAKIMSELNLDVSADTIADFYKHVVNGFVYDERDDPPKVPNLHYTACDTLMTDNDKRIALAEHLLRWIEDWK